MPDEAPMRSVGSCTIVQFPDEVDMANADSLGSALSGLFRMGATTVIVDMGGTTFCASSGFAALLHAHEHRPAGGNLCIAARTRQVARTSALIGIEQAIPCYPTVADALTAHRAEADRRATGTEPVS